MFTLGGPFCPTLQVLFFFWVMSVGLDYILFLLPALRCCVFFSVRLQNLGDGGTDRRKILHDGTYRLRTDVSSLGAIPLGCSNPKF